VTGFAENLKFAPVRRKDAVIYPDRWFFGVLKKPVHIAIAKSGDYCIRTRQLCRAWKVVFARFLVRLPVGQTARCSLDKPGAGINNTNNTKVD